MNFKNLPLALLFAALTQSAQAAHPLVTDDTGTQDQGNQQLELNTDWYRQSGGSGRVGAVTYTVGLSSNLDLFVNAPGTISVPRGLNDASLGLKWRLLESGPASLALKPELLVPTGNQDRGLGNGLTSFALTLIASYDAAPWALHGNLALADNRYALDADREANRNLLWRISAAATYALSEQVRLVLDSGVQRNADKASNANPGYVLTGLIYSPNKSVDIDAGIRFGIGCGDCEAQIDRQAGIGVTWRF